MDRTEQFNTVQPLLTDLYQISMAYAYWKSGKHDDESTFNLFFRKNPFSGEYTLFAGLEDCLKFIKNYKFETSDIEYLREVLPKYVEKEFFDYLLTIDMNDIRIYAISEGSVVFPNLPLLHVEGPLLKAQLLETALLTLINYASLVATNAARFCQAVESNKIFYEFGLRSAQGPDGGLSASRYCYLGGFHGTSNLLASKVYGIPTEGTHAHAYISIFQSLDEVKTRVLSDRITGESRAFAESCIRYLDELSPILKVSLDQVNKGELAAFISFAISFPSNFLALVDTYNVLRSGLPNFLAVALGLHECNYEAVGIRLDSGDLAYLSIEVRAKFIEVSQKFNIPYIEHLNIVASNDINEDTLVSLEKQGHSIDIFGIGTHLVTCEKQPALGCVYKLVELNGIPRIKVSENIEKVTIPGRKKLYRLYGSDGKALCDLMTKSDETEPSAGTQILCRHPFSETKRVYVTPTSVLCMNKLYWADGHIQQELPTREEVRAYVKQQIKTLRKDHRRHLNPTPYKVSVTDGLYLFLHELWLDSVPISELA